jgi:hypothetical protein
LNFEVPTSVKFSGEGCYTLPVCIEETYIGEALCDSGANANLMSVEKAKELGNLKMSPYNETIGYSNGHEEMAVDILYDFSINIGGYKFILNIVITDSRGRYDFHLILGRGFFSMVS